MFLSRLRVASRCYSSRLVAPLNRRGALNASSRLLSLNSQYSTNNLNFNDNSSYEKRNRQRNELMSITVAAVITGGAIFYILPKKNKKKSIVDEAVVTVTEVENVDGDTDIAIVETPVVEQLEVKDAPAVSDTEVLSELPKDDFNEDVIDLGETVVAEIVSDSVTGEQMEKMVDITTIPDDESKSNQIPPQETYAGNDKSEKELQALEEAKLGETEEEAKHEGAVNPDTGEINWDCACLGGMAYGPCGEEFKEAFACFVYSEAEPKGIDCVEKFQNMQNCFRRYPDYYAEQLKDEDDATSDETSTPETAAM